MKLSLIKPSLIKPPFIIDYLPRLRLVTRLLPLTYLIISCAAHSDHTGTPNAVSIPGSLQTAIGCPADWAPDCADTQLAIGDDGIWRGTFSLPEGEYEYKAALNNSWDENYGQGGVADGSNINLIIDEPTAVHFYYNPHTHWIADSSNYVIATAVGDFQTALGCSSNWDPECLRGWVQDPANTGIYQFTTTDIPPGNYEAKIALNESWDISYGDVNGNNIAFEVSVIDESVTFTYNRLDNSVSVGDPVNTGDLGSAKAHWLSRNTLVWRVPPDADVALHYDAEAGLTSSVDGVSGGEQIPLTHDASGLSDALRARFPHLADYPVFRISDSDLDKIPGILKQQTALSATTGEGRLIDATGLQIPGVLDDVFAYDGLLGPVYNEGVPTIHLWAPTAQSVTLLLYADGKEDTSPTELPMTFDTDTGVWHITGSESWDRQFYRFRVDVYVPATQAIEQNLVTDPYTISANTDGSRSQLVNLDDPDLQPQGWQTLSKPALDAPEDIVVYELHLRDFSISDTSVPEDRRGTFKAFTANDSAGMKHLGRLAAAGLTHVHLLPVFDCATIPENADDRLTLTDDLSVYAPDSTEQQEAINTIRGSDAFNWCYDPHHYTVPEGSYATNPEGTNRILEFREMVSALNDAGLRVIMDVVYNHTSQALLGGKSVLDKVVPGYYHRLNDSGAIERSSCCENTASEHVMMEKLMVDSLHTWATQYKVDGFRFDLMGHHSKANILKVRDTLKALTMETDGVDGGSLYIYGEGWNFGEVADDARFEQATQPNMAGTGIGTFNDRMRDAVRGGSPFDTGINHVRHQGFINGLYYDPNNDADTDTLEQLLDSTDRIRIGLAGNLKAFALTDWQGNDTTGDYDAQVGYTEDPQESIVYIAAHDNETLFDINQYKIPLDRDADTRVRVQNLGNSLVLLSQGVPFLHAGQEILRSKSMDRDSYDSGDWFNRLDYHYEDNGWARGLPPAWTTEESWEQIATRLTDERLAVSGEHIQRALAHVEEMLAIRKSSALFRLHTAKAIQSQLRFENTGADQKPGLIAMHLQDSDADLDPERDAILVLFNAGTEAQTLSREAWQNADFELHPVQQNSDDALLAEASFDNETGTFSVPARTTAVFQIAQQASNPGNSGGGKKSSGYTGALLLLLLTVLGARRRWCMSLDRR
ncbi:pullulanase-type alpha-1,6-glucosidase [Marinimicrobium sp. ARAG 43.8]|uniref:pullulanase-type alpha-1,6-glucosidase n=1 Tax=Marinimicrobium sp. ARAG 43.8 TaxID=3418719 RepID=UPI003CE9B492